MHWLALMHNRHILLFIYSLKAALFFVDDVLKLLVYLSSAGVGLCIFMSAVPVGSRRGHWVACYCYRLLLAPQRGLGVLSSRVVLLLPSEPSLQSNVFASRKSMSKQALKKKKGTRNHWVNNTTLVNGLGQVI